MSNTRTIEKLYMSPKEAAERYSIGVTSIYRIMNLPDAPLCPKIGQRRIIPISAFDEFIETLFHTSGKEGVKLCNPN